MMRTKNPLLQAAARELRKEQTAAEEALWNLLRSRHLMRIKFRRQVPIGSFIVDFYCHREKLVVELDGPIHQEPLQAAHDENRDFYLRSIGLTVLRFTNDRIFQEPQAVLAEIRETVNRRLA